MQRMAERTIDAQRAGAHLPTIITEIDEIDVFTEKIIPLSDPVQQPKHLQFAL